MTAAQSPRKNIHYEVQGCRGSRWTVLNVEHDERSAREAAEKLWKEGGFKAVRVFCEKFNTRTNTFKSFEINLLGSRPKAAPKKSAAPAGVCWKPGDLYSVEGRRNLTDFLSQYLERAQACPTELLHCPDYYSDLDNCGTELQNAVQRASIEQIQITGESIQERMRKIYSLVELAVAALREDWKAGQIPDLDKMPWPQAVAALEHTERKNYLLTCSIAGHLRPYKSLPEKFDKLLGLIDLNDPAWVFPVLDTYLAELLNFPALLPHIFGNQGSPGHLLIQMANLLNGGQPAKTTDVDRETVLNPMACKLNELMSQKGMSRCKRIILRTICDKLHSRQPISDGSLFSELSSLSDFLDHMRALDDKNKIEDQVLEAAKKRSARLITTQTIGDLLKGATSPVQSARILLDLSKFVIGEGGLKKIASELQTILESPQNEPYFRGMEGACLERIQTITRLQACCIRSSLLDEHKTRIAQKLDEDCIFIMKKSNIFSLISRSSPEPHKAGHRVLTMLAEGYFTIGKAQRHARQEARRYMRQPDFIVRCIGQGNSREKAEKMLTLKELMTKAGMATVDEE